MASHTYIHPERPVEAEVRRDNEDEPLLVIQCDDHKYTFFLTDIDLSVIGVVVGTETFKRRLES